MDLGLKGKKVIITGGTRGIGRAIVEGFANEGAHICFCARNPGEVDRTITELHGKAASIHGEVIDVSESSTYKKWLAKSIEQMSGVDIVIPNVSGVATPDQDTWTVNFNVDLMGSVGAVETCLPALEKSENAAVVLISSTAALEKFQLSPVSYNSIKSALLGYAGQISQTFASKGIRVNTVSPGPIEFPGGAWEHVKNNMSDIYQETLSAIPCGRMGKAEEVANAVLFLSSPASSFITGTNLVVDGGFSKRVQF